jgi:hypothetical protein
MLVGHLLRELRHPVDREAGTALLLPLYRYFLIPLHPAVKAYIL